MIQNDYNFEKFLEAIKDKSLREIQMLASVEAEDAQRLSSSSTREIEKTTKTRIGYYKKRVSEFAFFMTSGKKPGGVDDYDFELYQPICEILVKKGLFKPDVLEHFKDE